MLENLKQKIPKTISLIGESKNTLVHTQHIGKTGKIVYNSTMISTIHERIWLVLFIETSLDILLQKFGKYEIPQLWCFLDDFLANEFLEEDSLKGNPFQKFKSKANTLLNIDKNFITKKHIITILPYFVGKVFTPWQKVFTYQ